MGLASYAGHVGSVKLNHKVRPTDAPSIFSRFKWRPMNTNGAARWPTVPFDRRANIVLIVRPTSTMEGGHLLPLDPTLNAAILSIARNLFPDGFDVSPDAPSTYTALKAHLDAGKGLVVYDGGCAGTIYANPAVNHAFRAWNDWSHWRGDHDFSVEGEVPSSPCSADTFSISTATTRKRAVGSKSFGRR